MLVLLVAGGCGNTNSNGGGSGSPVAATVSGTIAVGTAPRAIAVDSTTNKIYVTDFGKTPTTPISGQGCTPSGADVEVIDGVTQQPIASVGDFSAQAPGPENPFAMALDAAHLTLYVVTVQHWSGAFGRGTCTGLGENVRLFDASSLHIFGGLSNGGGSGIDVNPTTVTLYIAHPFDFQGLRGDDVNVYSGENIVATISVGAAPGGVAVDATTNKIYVANSGSNNVSVIDGATNSVVATIADPKAVAPVAVAVNPVTDTIYVANSQSNNLTVINGATNSVTATIPLATSPSGLDVDPQTNFIYIANAGNSQTGDPGNITVIDGATHATTTLTDPKAQNPAAVAVNPVTNKIYVANSGSNNVTVIDGAHD